jgi:hypothetical protein
LPLNALIFRENILNFIWYPKVLYLYPSCSTKSHWSGELPPRKVDCLAAVRERQIPIKVNRHRMCKFHLKCQEERHGVGLLVDREGLKRNSQKEKVKRDNLLKFRGKRATICVPYHRPT